jgi:hypothetical protein
MNGKFNSVGIADENKYKILLYRLYLKTIKIEGLLHPAQADLRCFTAWFQSLQLPSAQSESPLASKFHVSFKTYSIRINEGSL